MLRKRFRWLLLMAGLVFIPAALRAQAPDMPQADAGGAARPLDWLDRLGLPAAAHAVGNRPVAGPLILQAGHGLSLAWPFNDEAAMDRDRKSAAQNHFALLPVLGVGPDQNGSPSDKSADSASVVNFGNASASTPQEPMQNPLASFLTTVRAQMGDVPPVDFTGPLSHIPYTDGGLYTGVQFLAYSTNQPLSSQVVAYRGFQAFDNGLGVPQGQWVGTKAIALNTNQVAGPSSFQPGWDLFIGWRFQGGVTVELDWKHLVQNQFSAAAALNPGATNAGSLLQNTFVTAQVYNYGPAWAGAAQNFSQGDVGSTFGIWDAASFMQELYIQRFDIYQINARIPITETADSRTYGLFGPRIAWIVDQYRWTTISEDQFGNDDGAALYNNTISNRMYGAHFGFGHDWYLGSTPIGAFAFTCALEGALYFDYVKTNAAYTLTNAQPQVGSNRSRRIYSIVPGVDGQLGVDWYPWEAIKLHMGYDVNTFFNTIASDQPIDFNLGRVTPQYEHQFLRYFYGFSFGISFVW